MENNEETFTPEESLRLISKVIVDTRRNFKYSSFFILLWGWVVLVGSLSCFFLIRYLVSTHQYEYINLWCWIAWGIPFAVGMATQTVYLRRINRIKRVKNQFAMIIKTLWYVTLVAMVLSSFIAWKLGFYPAPVILMVVGLSAFVTGYIIKFKPLMYGATIFGISSLVSVYISGDYQLLVNAFSIILGYLVPGYILKYSKN